MASIKDVAEAAGVSITTVSLVMNNKGHISKPTRDRVLRVVDELNYTRNAAHALNVRRKETRIIGFARRAHNGDPVQDAFLNELARQLKATDRHLLMFTEETLDEDELEYYHQLYASESVDAFVLSFTQKKDPRFTYLQRRNIPFVAFGRSFSPLDDQAHWVDIDGTQGLYSATKHLIEQGHHHIGMLAWQSGSVEGDARIAGYRRALMTRSSSGYDETLVVQADNSVQAGYKAASKLLKRDNPPTALVTCSDVLAVGAMRYVQAQGLHVAVTGYDDSPMARFTEPPLTTVRLPIDKAVAEVIERLVAQIDRNEIEEKNCLLKPELVVRESSLVNLVAETK